MLYCLLLKTILYRFNTISTVMPKSSVLSDGLIWSYVKQELGCWMRFLDNSSMTFRLRHFVYRHFVYRHFVYYCILGYRTVIHPTSVSENHYFHQFQLLLTL